LVVGRFFSSFEEAWAAFLVREEPLEDFFGAFGEDEAPLTLWLVLPGEAAAAEAAAIQSALSPVGALRATPRHWLHVAIGAGDDGAPERLRRVPAFEAAYGPANCFHDAIVLEAHAAGFRALAAAVDPDRDLSTFLPHVSVAYVGGAPPAAPVRELLEPLRDRPPVRERVDEVTLCEIPLRRSELLTPGRVVATVSLADTTSV
jgi:hypothetical protein